MPSWDDIKFNIALYVGAVFSYIFPPFEPFWDKIMDKIIYH